MERIVRRLPHVALARLQANLAVRSAYDVEYYEGARQAAVVAVFRVRYEPELLFIKRAEVKGDPWSGHIAFPGGRREQEDVTLEDTALREAHEELGLDMDHSSLIGRLDDLAPRSKLLPPIIVRPFVATVSADTELVPSREVASAFWVPTSVLTSPSTQSEIEVFSQSEGQPRRYPAYRVGDHVVWGITERIVRQLLSLYLV